MPLVVRRGRRRRCYNLTPHQPVSRAQRLVAVTVTRLPVDRRASRVGHRRLVGDIGGQEDLPEIESRTTR